MVKMNIGFFVDFDLPSYMTQDFFGNIKIENIIISAACTCSLENIDFRTEEDIDIEDLVLFDDFCRHIIAVLKSLPMVNIFSIA